MISRGCTCKNIFSFPYLAEEVELLYITYQQRFKTVVEKTLAECTIEDNKLVVMLSQEDTLQFDSAVPIAIQIRVKLVNGAVTKSKVIETYTDLLLKNEVI